MSHGLGQAGKSIVVSLSTATTPWYWNDGANSNLDLGSYAINGWLYTSNQWQPDLSMSFYQGSAHHAARANAGFHGLHLAGHLGAGDRLQPPTDLSNGTDTGTLGRICVARHPLIPNAQATSGQPLPSGTDMSYADGHAGKLPLQQIKNAVWHVGYTPIGDYPWKTGSLIATSHKEEMANHLMDYSIAACRS